MADRDDGKTPRMRSAVPPPDGPIAGSGAAPDAPPAEETPADGSPADAQSADAQPAGAAADDVPASARPAEAVAAPALARNAEPEARRRTWPAAIRRRIRAWSDRPNGRLAMPALLLTGFTALAGVTGGVVVPALGDASARPVRAGATLDSTASPLDLTPPNPGAALTPSAPATTVIPSTPAGVGAPATDGVGAPTTAGVGASATPAPTPPGRPSDVLAGWALEVGTRVGISPVAMQAYGYAELVLAHTSPGCHLTWTTLAAIGSVESNHGRANGAVLGPDGQALPPIVGLPLDGQGGRQRIADTDHGQLDGDPVFDRAVGPMQFIPSTWLQAGLDADNDGANNPHDIDDAALAAANYLCGNGRDLATARDWWTAILSYNDVRRYAQSVFDTANRYGAASRT